MITQGQLRKKKGEVMILVQEVHIEQVTHVLEALAVAITNIHHMIDLRMKSWEVQLEGH